jgi:hypothetical protein
MADGGIPVSAFLYHFHGLGRFDFSSLSPGDLDEVEELAAAQELEILPTVFLRREALRALAETVKAYGRRRAAGALPSIAGFAIEGPLLRPQGGIPRGGRWFPTVHEWRMIASLGPVGLRYIVLAPDAMRLEDEIEPGFTFADLLVEFYDHGLRIALGHFHRHNPDSSADRMRDVLRFLHGRYESSPYLVLTDHLYNDMPRNFTHAWRTKEERPRRAEEIAAFLVHDWETSDLNELLGPVPATMLAAAREGLLMPCINFDGHHVDLEICRSTFDYLGEDRLIALTDHTEVTVMAREPLTREKRSGLWLRYDGAVAAGSASYPRQRANMLSIGLSEEAVAKLFLANPQAAIAHEVRRASVRSKSGVLHPQA